MWCFRVIRVYAIEGITAPGRLSDGCLCVQATLHGFGRRLGAVRIVRGNRRLLLTASGQADGCGCHQNAISECAMLVEHVWQILLNYRVVPLVLSIDA